jgi:hypothetical protein
MLGLLLATNEGDIDIITDGRHKKYKKQKGKTGGIDVRHFEGSERSWIQVGRGTEY